MQRVLLIPTDLTIESLMLVKHAVLKSDTNDLRIVLMYCTNIPDSITDLFFYSPERILNKYRSREFTEACDILQSKVNNICISIFHGGSQSSFNSFVSSEGITEALIPYKYVLKLHKNAFNPLPYILNNGMVVNKIDWEEEKNLPEKGYLAELFFDMNTSCQV